MIMASIAIMVGGAVLNAAAFIGVNYLARALGGGDKAALEEKERHDKALEAYQAAYDKYTRDRTKLLDWIETNAQIKEEAKQNFTNTDYAFKSLSKFSAGISGSQPNEQQKNGPTFVRWHRGSCSQTAKQRFVSFKHGRHFLVPYGYGYGARKDSLQLRVLLENLGRFRRLCRMRRTWGFPESF